MPPYRHVVEVFVFFLFSNVGRGNECAVAAGLAEIPSEGEDDKQVSVTLKKMVNTTKVRI